MTEKNVLLVNILLFCGISSTKKKTKPIALGILTKLLSYLTCRTAVTVAVVDWKVCVN